MENAKIQMRHFELFIIKNFTLAMSSHVTLGTPQVLWSRRVFFLNEEFPSLHGHYYKLVSFSKMMDDHFFQHFASSHKNPCYINDLKKKLETKHF